MIGQRVAETDRRIRELRALENGLVRLRKHMRAEGVDDHKAPYWHFIETAR